MERFQVKTIMEKITTIHGMNQFSDKNGKSLFLWSVVMFINVLATIAFLMVIKYKFQDDQIYTKIDATCRVNQVPFPAVSICNFNMISQKDTQNIRNVLKRYNRTEKEINKFFQDLPYLKDFGYKSDKVDHAAEIMAILKEHYYTVDTIMEEVYQDCESLLIYCSFNRKEKNCNDIFTMIKTQEGHCCTFNYAALNDLSEDPLLPHDDTLEYYDGDEDSDHVTGSMIATSESGRTSGLAVVFNVEPEDYPDWSTAYNFGAKILINDPNDFPETSVKYKYVTIGTSVDIKVEPKVYQSEPDVRRVSPEKRACWFHDEINLEHTDRYSYETCMTECKMNGYIELCGCIPYKYPRNLQYRICELEDLKCLYNITVYGRGKPCDPPCYVECRDKGYDITSNVMPFLFNEYPKSVKNGIKKQYLSSIKVYFNKSTCNCYKLTLLMDVNYFIATYGGIFSLSFGASILTVIEIAYLLVSFLIKKIIKTLLLPAL